MTKRTFWISGLLLILAGCASSPSSQIVPVAGADGARAGQIDGSTASELSQDEVIYRLMLAEIAGQRGQFDVSIENLLSVAEYSRDARVAQRATRAAVYAKAYPEAERAAQLWAELAPEQAEAHQVVAALTLKSGDLQAATKAFQRALQLDPQGIEQGFLVVAGLLGREGKQSKDAALTIMADLVSQHQDNPYSYFAYANLAMLLGEQRTAEQQFAETLKRKPDMIQAIILHARMQRALGEVEAAIAELAQAAEQYPDNYNLRLAYSRMLLNAKRYPEAKSQFEVLLQQDPENSDLIYTLALLNLDMDLHEEAIRQFQRLLSLGKRISESQYYLGRIEEMRREYGKAIGFYYKVSQGEYRLDAQVRIALLLGQMDRVDEARDHLQALRSKTEEAPLRVRYYLAETDVLADARDYQTAVALLSEALLEIPGNTEFLYSRALLYERLDRIDLLENDLREVLLREPENADALNALGYTLADRTERYQEAYELIQQALKLKPGSAAITDSMGWVLYRLGRLPEALDYLKRALSIQYDGEIAAHLSEVLWVMGDHNGAETVLKQALEKNPEDEHLLNMIEQLQNGAP